MVNFLFLFVVVLALAYLTNYFLSHSFLGAKWRFFVAPGVIFHELSHALACKLTFARISKISFFDKKGGEVVHQPSPIPLIGPILISTAPLILGILLFYFLADKIKLSYTTDFSSIFSNYKSLFTSIDFSSWKNILIVYLLISITVTMTPSRQDLQNMLIPLIVLGIGTYLLINFTNINYGHFDYLFEKLSLILGMVVFVLLLFFSISIILHFVSKLIFKIN